jgi:MinD superfamily P-loop ATPase
VCINKYDLDEENSRRIERHCCRAAVEVAARIPFDTRVSQAVAQGVPVVEFGDGVVSRRIEEVWKTVAARR